MESAFGGININIVHPKPTGKQNPLIVVASVRAIIISGVSARQPRYITFLPYPQSIRFPFSVHSFPVLGPFISRFWSIHSLSQIHSFPVPVPYPPYSRGVARAYIGRSSGVVRALKIRPMYAQCTPELRPKKGAGRGRVSRECGEG
jgi:hypothetical protein